MICSNLSKQTFLFLGILAGAIGVHSASYAGGDEDAKTTAATQIQKTFRGYQARTEFPIKQIPLSQAMGATARAAARLSSLSGVDKSYCAFVSTSIRPYPKFKMVDRGMYAPIPTFEEGYHFKFK